MFGLLGVPYVPEQKTRTFVRMRGEGTSQTGPSILAAVEFAAPRGVLVNDILGYVSPTHLGAKPRKMSKSQKYPPKLLVLPEGMTCSVDIIPALIRLKFDNHKLLLLKYVQDEPYESIHMAYGDPIQ